MILFASTYPFTAETAILVAEPKIMFAPGHIIRNLSVLAQRNDLQKWKYSISSGQRWIVETVFSSIKRRFGEYVYSVRLKNMIQEMRLKTSLYNKMISI
jgi:hypothetical protein